MDNPILDQLESTNIRMVEELRYAGEREDTINDDLQW